MGRTQTPLTNSNMAPHGQYGPRIDQTKDIRYKCINPFINGWLWGRKYEWGDIIGFDTYARLSANRKLNFEIMLRGWDRNNVFNGDPAWPTVNTSPSNEEMAWRIGRRSFPSVGKNTGDISCHGHEKC